MSAGTSETGLDDMLVHWMVGHIAEVVGFRYLGQDVFGLLFRGAESDEEVAAVQHLHLVVEALLLCAKGLAGLDALQLIVDDGFALLELLLVLNLLLHGEILDDEEGHNACNCGDEA